MDRGPVEDGDSTSSSFAMRRSDQDGHHDDVRDSCSSVLRRDNSTVEPPRAGVDGDSIGNDARESHSRGSHKALSYGQLCDSDKEVARTKYCDSFASEELIFTELPLQSSYPFLLGFCNDFSAPQLPSMCTE